MICYEKCAGGYFLFAVAEKVLDATVGDEVEILQLLARVDDDLTWAKSLLFHLRAHPCDELLTEVVL